MKKIKTTHLMIFCAALFLSIISHSFYLWKWSQGYLMVGFGDGLSQMLFFKQFIIENYQQGRWAYTENFGFGSGLFSQLNYYYSTNIFLLPWYIIFSILPIKTTVETWALLLIPMSIIKHMAIFYACFYFLNYFTKTRHAAFFGAVLYMMSPFFFKNQIMVDILADVLFWVPLLFIGIERIIRNRSPLFFIIATALLLISSFYIAYIVLLLVIGYAFIRFLFQLSAQERTRKNQLIFYVISGLMSFSLSAFAFIPATISYLNNDRPPYTQAISWYKISANLFLESSNTLWLPACIPVFLCLFPLYRLRAFRLFAIISTVGTILYFSPMIGSLFNGFSAPNTRWTPIITLGYAGLVAITLENLNSIRKLHWNLAICITMLFILITGFYTHTLLKTLTILAFLWLIVSTILFFKKRSSIALGCSITLFVLLYANYFQSTIFPDTEGATHDFLTSKKYEPSNENLNIDYINTHALDDYVRTDWSVPFRENMPMLKNLKGYSMYSSISNGEIMNFYMQHLQIDTGRESVSRYRTLGDRTNLMALFQSQFYMRGPNYKNIPYLYEEAQKSAHFTLYENQKILPAFRVVNTFYNEKTLQNAPTLEKEHAMLDGAITNDGVATIPAVPRIQPTKITVKHATWKNGIFRVPKHRPGTTVAGRMIIDLPKLDDTKTLYVQMKLKPIRRHTNFELYVNDYRTTRRGSFAKYKTGFNDLTFAVPANEQVKIKLPRGRYHLTNLRIYGEDYKTLDAAYKTAKKANFTWHDANASGTVTAKDNDVLVTPIPYEPGWNITLNNEEVAAKKINYAFIGIPLKEGQNHITMYYKPPYWSIVWPISALSFILLIAWILWRKKSSANRADLKI